MLYALIEAPDGLVISRMFISGILTVSAGIAPHRSVQFRVDDVQPGAKAQLFRQCPMMVLVLKLDSWCGSAPGDVGYFSNEFFEHVFEGDDAAGGSVFVDDACEVGPAAA